MMIWFVSSQKVNINLCWNICWNICWINVSFGIWKLLLASLMIWIPICLFHICSINHALESIYAFWNLFQTHKIENCFAVIFSEACSDLFTGIKNKTTYHFHRCRTLFFGLFRSSLLLLYFWLVFCYRGVSDWISFPLARQFSFIENTMQWANLRSSKNNSLQWPWHVSPQHQQKLFSLLNFRITSQVTKLSISSHPIFLFVFRMFPEKIIYDFFHSLYYCWCSCTKQKGGEEEELLLEEHIHITHLLTN